MGDDVLDPCDSSFSIRPAIALLDSTISVRIAMISLLDGSSPGGLWLVEVDGLPMSLGGCLSCKNDPWLSVFTDFLTFLVEILALAEAVTFFLLLLGVYFPFVMVKITKSTKITKISR